MLYGLNKTQSVQSVVMNTNPGSVNPITRLVLLLMLLLAAATLVACGGDDAPEAQPTDVAPAATEAVVEDSPVEEAPTAEPTAVSPTETPTEEPTAEPTAGTTSGATLAGNCANAYFPVVDGRVYTYSTSISGFGVSNFTQTYSDVTDDSFTMTIDSGSDEAFSNTWTCTGEGMLSPEFTQMPGGMEGMLSIDFVEAEGVTLPSEGMFQPGESWTTHYVAEALISIPGSGEIAMTQTVDLTNNVIGTEAVSVPAGDFDNAMRVDTTGAITMDMGNTGMTTTIDMSYSSWYVENVGLVRQEFSSVFGVEGANNPSVTELLSYEDQ